ncbi:MAG: ATP-binding cassette domain-containing protein [Polyangia bacterium]|jgi:phospholipid/cholesterol/gamma-HCH transport system ATP-binding protein|nr:ATP-binding cassette domain-containing protein [Polyangia bacterium]
MTVEFRDVHKSFGDKAVLTGLSLKVEKGEVMFIIGTSGVGKSVTIKHLIGLLKPSSGEILLDGQPVQDLPERDYYPIRKRCAMVFQSSTLFDSLSVLENVVLPLRKHKRLKDRRAEQEALALLEKVGMAQFAQRFPAELGDGMRKRVAIARALTLDPEYVLFDEPTTGLDPVSARRVDQLIRRLSDEFGVTSIVVSHDLVSIFSVADRIAMVYKGRIHLVGKPGEFRASPDPVVQQFISGRSSGPMETPGF